ncbi:HisA/HisF-related TIM barrel protein [Rubinisphaera sp.]|uniref:HisA/HisF-related TIM barrel protein n=1 Tax=Rubinisphaera sp. TaxID=2024857 RepID=UPI000C0D673E|nr:HisA/HisF-related TIM barrel protein [Rubinisphaera sp.]MBV11288.1 hypothetical protein [Rubinisphaera sp.]HCS53529.1 hypothetical protein [Planctomycetaceae bacterium]|tara:strand:+ start:101 stop:871 length:771 start_codon:yes stop_codon:yes gene_type:complete
MKIIPVLDILNGVAVHAVGGLRSSYQPLKSKYCESPCPVKISETLKSRFGLCDWYIADLDGIVHRRWNLNLLSKLAGNLGQLRIDAGIRQIEDLFELGSLVCTNHCIISSESLTDCSVLDSLVCMCEPRQFVFSLDLVDGQLNAPNGAWGKRSLIEIIEYVAGQGIQEIIILDLAYIGSEKGPGTSELCAGIRKAFPDLQLITGGGIRTCDQLKILEQSGVDSVLVGTALHHGLLTEEIISRYCLESSGNDSNTRG